LSEEGFLARWSRRKRAAEAGLPEDPPATAPEALPAVAPEAAPAPAEPAEPEFDPASLPPVESLTAESDFTAFLRKEVPEALKRAALRRAWALDPAIRDFVGPADYAWDFNAPDGVPGFSLELGGDVQKLLAQAMGLDREEAPAPPAPGSVPAPSEEPSADPSPAPVEPAAPALAEAEAPPAIAAEVPAQPPEDGPEAVVASPRRHGSALPS
jgi:hypothetical protein